MIIIDYFDKLNTAQEYLFSTFWCQYMKLHLCLPFEQFCLQFRQKSQFFLRISLKGSTETIRLGNLVLTTELET